MFVTYLLRVDTSGSGFITTESFINVLNSRDLGLQLNEEDIRYLVDLNNMYGNDQIPFMHVTPQLPAHLMTLYRSRAEHSLVSNIVFVSKLVLWAFALVKLFLLSIYLITLAHSGLQPEFKNKIWLGSIGSMLSQIFFNPRQQVMHS